MLLITAIHRLQISQPLGRGFQIQEGLFLTNDKEHISKLIGPTFRKAMGEIEFNSVINIGHVIYATDEQPESLESEELVLSFLDLSLRFIKLFFNCLWTVKDNAVNCEFGYVEWILHSQKVYSSNFVASLYSGADGQFKITNFTTEELKKAREAYSHLASIKREQKPTVTSFNKEIGRLPRFIDFIIAARSNSELAIRISLSMTCLEILFSTDAAELTHKLSQRVACFMGDTREERLILFQTIKRAYSIRSKVVHGDVLQSKAEAEIVEIALAIDTLLRLICNKIVFDSTCRAVFENSKEELEKYLTLLTFDDRTSATETD